MKLIVAGATGMAGKAIVKHCLSDDRITSLVILTRKPMPADVESNPKVQVVMHQDFSTYPDELLQKLHGAEACIWAIGGRVDQCNNDVALCRTVNVGFSHAAAKAMSTHLPAHLPAGASTFRFVFLSGKYSEWDPAKTLYFLGDSRRIKGEAEKGLCELADAYDGPAAFKVWALRPSGFVEEGSGLGMRAVGALYSAVGTAQLARALVRVACEGWAERIIENDVVLKL